MKLRPSPSVPGPPAAPRLPGRVAACALVWAAIAGAAPPCPAQIATEPPADPWVAAAVARRVAERWGVDPAGVVLEWPALAGSWPPEGATDVALVGNGAGGHWVVRSDAAADPGVRVRAAVRRAVPRAARDLPQGHVLAEADVEAGQELAWGPPGADPAPSVVGWRTVRPLSAGEALRPPAAQPPLAVRPGEAVEVVWTRAGVSITLPGTAAGAAPVGGEVAVRTRDGRRLHGVARAPGVVDVTQGGGR
ncbi:MAG TPA: flagellar basal body P-ring formation chaperone FlgA [Longimicrobiales bacterium]|nr:flagellar basal body P-ring formation chaperone FlgA [Longimicrobiales bacterium]